MAWIAGIAAIGGGLLANKSAGAAVDAQKDQNKANEAFIREQAINARNDAIPLYGAAQDNRGIGAQAALDVFGQSIPEQGRLFQGGNVAAQGMILAGLPQANNALLGMPIDYSQFQTQQLSPDYSWAQQQVPQFQNPQLRQVLNPGDMVDANGMVVTDPNYHPQSPDRSRLMDKQGFGSIADKITGGAFRAF